MAADGHDVTPTGVIAQDSLQRLADRLVADVPTDADSGAPAGVVLGVSIGGRRTTVASGHATAAAPSMPGNHDDPSAPSPVTVDTAFDLASVTKVAGTTAALLKLVSSGELRLDSAVLEFIPEFSGHDETTIRDLLLHRAGLWEWQPLYLSPAIDEGGAPVLDGIPPRYPLRSGRHYSDLGFLFLGRVIERVTGRGLDSALRELVFSPVGMINTFFAPPTSSLAATAVPVAASAIGDRAEQTMVDTGEPYPVRWRANGFSWREHQLISEANDGNCFHAFGGIAGHAGLFSTAHDLLGLAEALSGHGVGGNFAKPDTVAEFFAPGDEATQALGFRRTMINISGAEHALLWHPGFTGCAVGVLPELGLGISLLSNRLLTRSTPLATVQLWEPVVSAAIDLYASQNTVSTTYSPATDLPAPATSRTTDTRTP